MKNKILNILSLIFNLLTVALVTYSVSTFFTAGGEGNMEVIGFECFRYFTVLSNVLAAFVSLVFLVFNIKNIKNGITSVPFTVLLLKFAGTVSVTVTLLTVLFFLGPTMGYRLMFEGVNLILHAVAPILAVISFTMFELNNELKLKQSLYGLIPTVLYSIVYVTMVLFVKGWEDFYGFTFGGKLYLAPVSLIMMYLATMAFSLGLVAIHNFMCKKVKLISDAKSRI